MTIHSFSFQFQERMNQTLLFGSEIDDINWQAQSLPDNHRQSALVNSQKDLSRAVKIFCTIVKIMTVYLRTNITC